VGPGHWHADGVDADPFGLARFVEAQDAQGTYESALRELRAGRKRGHWIWFVLPQLAGLGRSPTAQHYGITGRDEARAYLAHPVLRPRLVACCRALLELAGSDPVEVLGETDALKLRSSMTLFAAVEPDEPVFQAVLDRCCGGQPDPLTLRRL
jgi:uncharacterized protein (DUF1810 family)